MNGVLNYYSWRPKFHQTHKGNGPHQLGGGEEDVVWIILCFGSEEGQSLLFPVSYVKLWYNTA